MTQRPLTIERAALDELFEARLAATLFRGSTHALSVAEAIELARALDRMPARLEIYGIEGRCFTAGSALTAEVERAVQLVCRELESRYGGRGDA